MSEKPVRRGRLLAAALVSGVIAGWWLNYAVFSPLIVGPLFFIALSLTCFFLAIGAHYFHRWWAMERPHREDR
ncbi:hypothetical protein [Arthrobacter antioxidans]|uniref:hypothetical protein n=1 Tax=Arthrobacter antioxidans TaxID=2895818 RepID=UPI001FFF9EC7|nr:hypothetical protein [Arthrobacter antioxidans]